ncbi:hypothetical protein E4T49_01000 [Aureobasidium sp. EXF-10728]|nr:hypothetical protein E4T49_01000 [Aureobasidium sp. EXF-10728]
MAAAVSPRPSTAFDLRNTIPYTIRVGRQLSSCSSIQYNHKPDLSDPDSAESSICHASEGGRVTLSLKDGADEYKYTGTRHNDDDEYLLLLDDEGKDFVLEKIASSYALNLTRAPWESSSKVLVDRYPQLRSIDDDEHGEDFEHADDNDGGVSLDPADADAANPFDFRHYLDVEDSPSPNLLPARAAPSATPAASQTSTRTNTPIARSIRKQTSAFAPQSTKPLPKPRVRPAPAEGGPTPKHVARSPSPETQSHRKTQAQVPAVRLDRRASTRVALPSRPPPKKREPEELSLDDDDDGDLILEGDEPERFSYHSNNSKSSLGLALTNGLGEGPRSLRSAASSPAGSHINSPAAQRPSPLAEHREPNYDEDELVMDPDEEANEYDQAESDADEDGDVDALQLPSPAQAHRPSISGPTISGDDDYDLEKQMLLELEGGLDDDAASGQQGGADSDEESEEE